MKDKKQYQVGLVLPLSETVRPKVVSALADAGYELSALVEEETKTERMFYMFLTDKELANQTLADFQKLSSAGVKAFCRINRESDWASSWKKGWKPFSLTRKFHVIPLWQPGRFCPAGKTPILLDTTNAFGTGLHETTRFTARIIEGLEGKFGSFLDVGTGSGILAIVALRSKATSCLGLDIDPDAVKVARQNLKVNGLKCPLKACDVKDFKPAKPFDLVAANLVSHDLIEYRDRIISLVKPGGYLVISGISLANIPRVRKAFAQIGLAPRKLIKGREWSAMLFINKQ